MIATFLIALAKLAVVCSVGLPLGMALMIGWRFLIERVHDARARRRTVPRPVAELPPMTFRRFREPLDWPAHMASQRDRARRRMQ